MSKIALITFILLVICGSAIEIYLVKVDKKPKAPITYKLRGLDKFIKLYIPIPLILLCLYMAKVSSEFILRGDTLNTLILLVPTLFLAIMSIPALILFTQYFRIENSRVLHYNPVSRELTLVCKTSTNVVRNEEIESVEYNKAKVTRASFSDYEFVRVLLKDKSEVIITNLRTDLNNFERLFKGTKRSYKRNYFNWLK